MTGNWHLKLGFLVAWDGTRVRAFKLLQGKSRTFQSIHGEKMVSAK
jgi:hypothetical protein